MSRKAQDFKVDSKGRKPKLHCKDKIPKFRNKYSHKRNIGVSVPISTFMRLGEIYIFPRSVSLFCWRKYVDRWWVYINRSQTHECWNWGWGRAIPRKGIHKGDFRCSVYYKLKKPKGRKVRNLIFHKPLCLLKRQPSSDRNQSDVLARGASHSKKFP